MMIARVTNRSHTLCTERSLIGVRILSIKKVQRTRHMTQIGFLVIMTLLPILDLFRLDMAESRFVILGKYFFINQLYLALIAFGLSILILALVARNFGRIFCGWLCFQTTWSEIGDSIVHKWRKVKKLKDPKKRGKLLIQIIALLIVVIPVMLAFYSILVSYFVAPKVMWSWLTIGPPTWFLVLFAKFSVFGYLDLLVIRHSFCATMCPYGIMQQKAQKNYAMRISFDPNQCIDCGLCDQACLMDLKPRELKESDPCISCAECIVACGVKAEKLAARGVQKGSINSLSFGFQSVEPEKKKEPLFDLKTVSVAGVFVIFTSILLFGVTMDDGVDLGFNMAQQTSQGQSEAAYDLEVTNRTERPLTFKVQLEPVDIARGSEQAAENSEQEFSIQPASIELDPLSKKTQSVTIKPNNKLASGRYTLLVRLMDDTGKEVESTKTVYYVY